MFDLALKSNYVVTPQGVGPAVVIIQSGQIADVVHPDAFTLDRLIDLGNDILLPGVIDPHVHINEPGRTGWEGFDTATRSAIAGGVTTLVDMPLNSSPVTTNVNAFEKKLSASANQLHCHCGFWGGVIPGNENDIEGLIEKGVLGFKAFLTHSGIDDFPNVTESDLRKVMPLIAKHNLPLLVHCELINGIEGAPSGDPRSYRNYVRTRPSFWEHHAISLMIRLCQEYDCRVHIVHLSSSGALEQIRKAKELGLRLTVETAPHYLYFNEDDIGDGQTQFKCAPPIRDKANNALLWNALEEGVIDFIATDHSPAPPEMKQMESGNFMKAWGGIASLQLSLPVISTMAKKKKASFNQVAKWLCEEPAVLAGLQNSKGKIAKGFDADLVVFDPDAAFLVTEDMLYHKHKITPYLGHELYGVVERTYLAGNEVYNRGAFMRLNQGKILIR